ncbi:MAG: cation:proton antiporter [Microthrixaceae bacterium]
MGSSAIVLAAESSTSGAEQTVLAIAAVILLGPFLIGKLRMPGIVGLVLGGAVIGPQALGLVGEGQLDGVGDIGLLYLMFMAGLELDLLQLKQHQKAALRFGLLTFAFPFLIGWVGAALSGQERASAILLGSIWASHTLVSLPEVKRAGLMGNRAVAICVSATALTDTLALVVLAVVTSGAADDPGGRPMLMLAIGLVVLAAYTLWLIPLVGGHVFRVVAHERGVRFVFLLAAFSSSALIAGAFGIEGLVGAFLAGMGANRLVPAGGRLMEHTEFMGEAFFIPAFLVFVGTQLDLAALGSVETLSLAAAYVTIVVVGKGLAAVVTGRLERLGWAEVGLVTGLSSGQAAATLAATLVGQSVGLFDQNVVNGVLVAVLAVILISSLTTAFFAAKVKPTVVTERALGATVLLSVPPEGVSAGLIAVATRLAMAHAGRLVPVRVVDSSASADERAQARAEVDAVAEVATRMGADTEGVVRIDSAASEGVLHALLEHDASVVVIPWDLSTTRAEAVFGRTLDEVGKRSPVPIVAGHVIAPDVTRAVLRLDGADASGGPLVDEGVAAAFLGGLAAAGVPASVVNSNGSTADALNLNEAVEVDPEPDAGDVGEGGLEIVPFERRAGWPVGGDGPDGDRSVLVVAGPYRFRTTSTTPSVGLGSILGLERD